MIPFEVGDKVVCVNAKITHNSLREGATYTVQRIGPCPLGDTDIHLWLEETQNVWTYFRPGEDIGFTSTRFRPVKKTNIDVFKAILTNPPKELVE